MNDIDKILKAALSPTKYPSDQLNDKIMKQMKESGEMRFKNRNLIIAAAVVICLLIIPTSAYAAYRYLLPKDAAIEMQDDKLGESFEKSGTEVLQTVTDGLYKVTYLGHVSGESISERTGSVWELHPERTYVAVAIEKTDGTEMSDEDGLFVSPLIQGLKPWSYNIASMNGSYMGKVIDGVLYRIIECDNIEMFADKELYLAVSNTIFYSVDAFNYDEETGLITVNEAYNGTNILFDMELDSSKADPEKAEAYLKQLEEEWNSDTDTEDKESISEKNGTKEAAAEENPRIQQEVFSDEENGITFRIKDNESSSWWADDTKSETVFSYYFDVEGDGIESLTYTLNKGEFCHYPKNNPDGRELYGNKYSISYEEQDKIASSYSILFRAKYTDYGYDIDDLTNLGVKDIEARNKIYYEVLNKEVESTNIGLEIKMKDGRVINKKLTLKNVLDEIDQSFWLAMLVE